MHNYGSVIMMHAWVFLLGAVGVTHMHLFGSSCWCNPLVYPANTDDRIISIFSFEFTGNTVSFNTTSCGGGFKYTSTSLQGKSKTGQSLSNCSSSNSTCVLCVCNTTLSTGTGYISLHAHAGTFASSTIVVHSVVGGANDSPTVFFFSDHCLLHVYLGGNSSMHDSHYYSLVMRE